MARTEKKFGQVVEPAANVNNELVASSIYRRNLSINITARSSAKVSITTFTSSPSYTVTGLALKANEIKNQKITFSLHSSIRNHLVAFSTPDLGGTSAMIITKPATAAAGNLPVGFASLNGPGTENLIDTNISSYGGSFEFPAVLSITETGFSNYGLVSDNQDTASDLYRTIHTAPFKKINNDLYVAISANTGTAVSGSVNVAFLIDTSSATNTWSSRVISNSDFPTNGNRMNSVNAVYSTSVNKTCAVIQATPINQGLITSNTTTVPLRIYVAQKTTGQAPATIGTTRAIFSGTFNTVGGNLTAAFNAFHSMDYNRAKDVFAISHGTLSNSIGSATDYSGTPAGVVPTIPSAAAPAGFRILTPQATDDTPARFFDGTDQYPASAPGVVIPATDLARIPQVASLKFSPDGNHLAVMYNRDYSGTGNAMSVAVIYSVDSAGTWSHSYSSGPSILYRGGLSDSMLWLPDNSGLVIISGDSVLDTERYVQFWIPMTGTINYVHGSSIENVGISRYSSGPKLSSMFKISSTTSQISSAVTTSLYDGSPGTIIAAGFITSASSMPRLYYITSFRSSSTDRKEYLKQIKFIDLETAPIVGSSASSAPAYVNTVAQEILLDPGQTIQISNIVVEPGEKVYVESSTSDSVDVTAYGVEIS